MKTWLRIFFLGLLLGASLHAKAKKFEWKLDCNQATILRGVITSDHEDNLSGRSVNPCWDWVSGEGYNYQTFESVFTYAIMLSQNQPELNLPLPFSILLNDDSNNLNHRFSIHYTFRAHIISAARRFVGVFCALCCLPCTLVNLKLTGRLCCETESYEDRLWELEAARPDNVSGNVEVHARSLSHQCRTGSNNSIGSATHSDINAETTVFDLFMTAPVVQQWLIQNLNHPVQLTQMVMIPGLFNSGQSTQVLIQMNNDSEPYESMVPTHFLTFTTGGVIVQYHLNQSSGNQINVLGIVITYAGYTMVINEEGYNISGHEPPTPQYSEIDTLTCGCTGACMCRKTGKNDSDDAGAAGGYFGLSGKPILLPSSSF